MTHKDDSKLLVIVLLFCFQDCIVIYFLLNNPVYSPSNESYKMLGHSKSFSNEADK